MAKRHVYAAVAVALAFGIGTAVRERAVPGTATVLRWANGPEAPKVSEPFWIVPPYDSANVLTLENGSTLPLNTSNNNLAIKVYRDRLYVAFRSASHHHPKPPIWSPQHLRGKDAQTRLYVVSTPMDADRARALPNSLAGAAWRLEFEGNDVLRRQVLQPMVAELLRGDVGAMNRFRQIYGAADADPILRAAEVPTRTLASDGNGKKEDLEAFEKQFRSVLAEFDLREPFFFEFGGKLVLYFQQVEGRAMHFNSLHTWAMQLGNDRTTWDAPVPVLLPKEHFWEIQKRTEKGREVAYLTSYSGGHYTINADEQENFVHFRRSTDGMTWQPVDNIDTVYAGGASEAGFTFTEDGGVLSVLRLDDGDARGWGALFARARPDALGSWSVADRADPRRFDSPRLFVEGKRIYLLARQNLCGPHSHVYDLRSNCPYDRSFASQAPTLAERARESILRGIGEKVLSRKSISITHDKMLEGNDAEVMARGNELLRKLAEEEANGVDPRSSSLRAGMTLRYEIAYYMNYPKRTTLYWFDEMGTTFQPLVILPSSGDTGFPSIESIGEGDYLVGNYSSPPEDTERSWRSGQEKRTGIYLVRLQFPK